MPVWRVPEELKDDAVILEFPPPGVAELDDILSRLTATPGVKVNLTSQGREKLVHAALGLSSNHARRIFSKAIVAKGGLDERDIDLINYEKKQVVRESGALEFFSASETIADVGGLEVLKEWVRTRERAFSQEARDYGLPAPKGIALIGIPGTGKSLTAKMIAGLWRLPLLRLDLGGPLRRTGRSIGGEHPPGPHTGGNRLPLFALDRRDRKRPVGRRRRRGHFHEGCSRASFPGCRKRPSPYSWLPPRTTFLFFPRSSCVAAELTRYSSWTCRHQRNAARFSKYTSANANAPFRDTTWIYSLNHPKATWERRSSKPLSTPCTPRLPTRESPGRDFTTDDIRAALAKQVPISLSQKETVQGLRSWLAEGRAQSASSSSNSRSSST